MRDSSLSLRGAFAVAVLCLLAAAGVAVAQEGLPAVGRMVAPELLDEPAGRPFPSGRRPNFYEGCRPRRPAALLPAIEARGVAVGSPNPLLGARWFVDPEEPAYRQWRKWRRKGQTARASVLWRLAREPRFRWFGKFTKPNMPRRIRQYLARARCLQPGAIPQMVVMRHAGRRCRGGYLGGGPAEDAATRRWYRKFARAVGSRRVVIGFEPDSVGTIDCLAPHRRDDRIRTLRYGVDVLSRLPNATIYLEGTASDWEPAGRVARILRRIGIHQVRGFMLNVTHHDWTVRNIAYGLKVSRKVGGKPFVISTAYNGRGPVHYKRIPGRASRRINVWCHPGYRGLGPPPTTATSHPKVDAYLYINRPGFSAGSCNGGPLPVGTWWPRRALMYARLAMSWESPPAGTRHGHYKRLTGGQLGIHR